MSSDFESVAEQFSAINEDGMSRVSKLAQLQLTLEERVKALEEDVKEAKRSLKEVAEMVAHKFNVKLDFVSFPEQAAKIESGDTIFDDLKLQFDFPYTYQHHIKKWIDSI